MNENKTLDLDKIIKAIECCNRYEGCSECPYYDSIRCEKERDVDIIAHLKEYRALLSKEESKSQLTDGIYYKHDETVKPVHLPFKIGDVVYSVERVYSETNHVIIIYRVAGYDLRHCKENGLRLTTLIAIDVNTELFKHFNIEHGYNNYLFPTFEEAEKKLMELRKEKEAK